MSQIHFTQSSEHTKKIGKELAKSILKSGKKRKNAFVIGLRGDLGSGKTTFLQGFAKGLGVKEKILSPTFVILKKFLVKKNASFYHIDCYRLKNEKDILELGFKEMISNPDNIIAVEWPEKIKKVMPKDSFFIDFAFIDKETRKINC